MAKCLKCEKENEIGATTCANCGASLASPQTTSADKPQPAQPKQVGSGTPPKELLAELTKFANALDTLAVLLAFILVLGGGVIAYNTASIETLTTNALGLTEKTSHFDWVIFASTGITYLVYAAIVYSVFVAISLILRSQSVIVHTNRSIASNIESIAKSDM